MDDTIIYIKKCNCFEIQSQWNPESSDWIAEYYQKQWDVSVAHMCNISELKRDEKGKIILLVYEGWDTFNSYENPVWLPTQDQIQKMIHKLDNFQKIYKLAEFIERHDAKYLMGEETRSIEQLWLAFYMYRTHGKVWNKDKWIKQ